MSSTQRDYVRLHNLGVLMDSLLQELLLQRPLTPTCGSLTTCTKKLRCADRTDRSHPRFRIPWIGQRQQVAATRHFPTEMLHFHARGGQTSEHRWNSLRLTQGAVLSVRAKGAVQLFVSLHSCE